MSGICGGIKDKVNFGDIIVAETSWNYESGKWTENVDGEVFFEYEPKQIRLSSSLVVQISRMAEEYYLLAKIKEDFLGLKPDTQLMVHAGVVASGSSVRASKDALEIITSQNRKAIAFEMETYGFMLAAQHAILPRPQAMSIKSVCDFGDVKKDDRFQNYAAFTSTRFIFEWARKNIK